LKLINVLTIITEKERAYALDQIEHLQEKDVDAVMKGELALTVLDVDHPVPIEEG